MLELTQSNRRCKRIIDHDLRTTMWMPDPCSDQTGMANTACTSPTCFSTIIFYYVAFQTLPSIPHSQASTLCLHVVTLQFQRRKGPNI